MEKDDSKDISSPNLMEETILEKKEEGTINFSFIDENFSMLKSVIDALFPKVLFTN